MELENCVLKERLYFETWSHWLAWTTKRSCLWGKKFKDVPPPPVARIGLGLLRKKKETVLDLREHLGSEMTPALSQVGSSCYCA